MSADIFGAGLDREVDALFQRAEIKRARPGVLHEEQCACGMYGSCNGRNVLDFERERARRLDEYATGIRFHQPGDVGADHRIVIRRLDPVALEHVVAELASGEIYTVGDEHMVTG